MGLGKTKQTTTRKTDKAATDNRRKQGEDKANLLDKFWDKTKDNNDDEKK
ncbi:hypothetical protein [Kitasatospora sp. NPDC001527]